MFFLKIGNGQKFQSMTDVHSDEKKASVSIGRNLQQRLERRNILLVSQRTCSGALHEGEGGLEGRRVRPSG